MPVKRHMHKALGFAAFAAVVGIAGGANATTLDVSATVPDSCSVNPGALAFGEYVAGVEANSKIGMGDFSVTCGSAASVKILLDKGLHYQMGNNGRAMLGGSSGDFLDYELYQGAAGQSSPWGDDGATYAQPSKPVSLSATTTTITVQGLIAANQAVGGGNYSDTIGITLVFNP